MDSLLPSEIARLVLGYLEEQKCSEAARSFLEMSPHLQECRAVASTGRRFSTRVNGVTLADILEKFCAANAIIHERLSKVSECEQLKHCGDLLEQLRFLVDGSRGQRFVVNINVPTASQASGGSPIISSSIRKRHYSGSDRDRSKRAYKSQSLTPGKSTAPITDQLSCDAVETTPLEHLPGHSSSERLENPLEKSQERLADCSSTVTEAKGVQSLVENSYTSVESIRLSSTPDIVKPSMEKQVKTHESCSTATDTEELMQFTNTEVQTTYSMPYDVAESENESNNEPVENLSLLTKELLNRTELQERIAENINKAILPSDISLRDVSMSESLGGEMNTSIMTELNNAIKSVVTATESDPVFAKFLDEIIGPNGETDTSPDEDADQQPTNVEQLAYKPDSLSKETVTEILDKIVIEEPEVTEVPLKNRLRSSSSQQVIRPEDDRGSQKPVPKDDIALEDVNAAAILSIINANNKLDEEISNMNIATESVCNDADKKIPESKGEQEGTEITIVSPVNPIDIDKSTVPSVEPVPCPKILRKSNLRKPRAAKTKTKIPPVINEEPMSDETIMGMPTLIVCSKEEMTSLIGASATVADPISGAYCSSQFLPIAPKTSDVLNFPRKPEPVYLRTVVVPTKIPKNPPILEKHLSNLPLLAPAKPRQRNRQRGRTVNKISTNTKNVENNVDASCIPVVLDSMPIMEDKEDGKITLYSNENNTVALLDNSSVPKIQVDEPVIISGTGLSPFLKFNDKPIDNTLKPLVTMNVQPEVTENPSTSKPDNYDLISKRTPRSLLKSRSKNNRLSLSTPRRRSSHVRALDFNTPTKCINSSRRMSTNESMEFSSKNSSFAKKVCRTSLFKSPPFTPTAPPSKTNSSTKDHRPCIIPIATRSPAPKLEGGWEKYTGVGMILGCSSPSSASSSPIKATVTTTTTTTMTTTSTTTPEQPQTTDKGWDEDLRKPLQLSEDPARVSKKATTKKQQQCKSGNEIPSNCETEEITKDSDNGSNRVSLSPCPAKEEHLPFNDKIDNEPRKIEESPIVEQLEVISGKENANSLKKGLRNSLDNVDVSKTTETITSSITTVETASSNVMKTVKKKYAQLKTITTSVTKIDRDFLDSANETIEKSGDFSRAYSEVNRQLQLADMLDLETPRKFDCSFGIPPTPRLLSPGSSLTTPFGQIDEETSKVRGFVSTPEFPPTPSIALTPKQMGDDTVDASKKEEFGACSSYYQPSTELKDPRLPKQHSDQSRHDMSLPLPGMMLALTSEKRVQNISVQVAQGFQACTTSDKWEITQFEVIKENLPREEAVRELKISGCANESPEAGNTSIELPVEVDLVDSINDDTQDEKDPNNTSSTIDDSSDSDTSSSSDSSTSSSSSSSCCSSITDTSANLTITKTRRTPNKIETDTSNGSIHKLPDNSSNVMVVQESTMSIAENVGEGTNVVTLYASRHENEASPQKVFSIVKTDDQLVQSMVETPAKDESLLIEAVISETPSSSKAGIETTNLNSKISAFITSESREKTNETNDQSKDTKKVVPKVVSVQTILPNVSIAIKPAVMSPDVLCNAMQSRNQISDAKLSRQLEEKRLRIMAKFKEKEKPIVNKPKIKRAMSVPRNRRDMQVQRDSGKTVDGTKSDGEEKSSSKDKSASQVERKESSMDGSSKKLQEVIAASRNKSHEEEKKGPTKRNVNEEEEREKIMKNETRKKFQKRKNDEVKERILKAPIVNNEASNEGRTRKDCTRKNEETEGIKTKQMDEGTKERINTEHKKKPSRSRSKSDLFETEKDSKEQEVKAREAPVKLVRIAEELSDENNINNSKVSDEIVKSVDNSKKDKKESSKESTLVETKTVAKSKVDLVKRDLFSDEESNDQRTTRSRTRQTSDAQRSDSTDSYISVVSPSAKDRPSSTPKEDLPGVLECLELVPTLKSDQSDENIEVVDCSQQCHAEYHFIYDDSVPTKRRKRKFSSSELEFPVEVELSDENFRVCPKLMTATVFEEVFNLSPPRRRRAPTKETTVKSTKYKKKENSGSKTIKIFKGIQNEPLATSSPVLKTALTSKVAGKSSRSPTKNTEQLQTEARKKSTKNDNNQQEYERQNPKTRKRKASASRESEQVEKKPRAPNPQLLLHKVDLDKFLTTVHGPG